jgi:hypothetical protein
VLNAASRGESFVPNIRPPPNNSAAPDPAIRVAAIDSATADRVICKTICKSFTTNF